MWSAELKLRSDQELKLRGLSKSARGHADESAEKSGAKAPHSKTAVPHDEALASDLAHAATMGALAFVEVVAGGLASHHMAEEIP